MKPIYMDHNATTPIDERVYASMNPYLKEHFGNASSSSHAYGWRAQMGVEKARKQVADLIGCEPKEVIFTSGATESNNLSIIGSLLSLMRSNQNLEKSVPHFITSNIEHKAVLEVFDRLKLFGAETTVLPVNNQGVVEPKDLTSAIKPNTHLVSIMGANNEIGSINPVKELAKICDEQNILFHTDYAQLLGREEVDFSNSHFSMLSLSGHKIYGPKGIGALIVREKDQKKICPLVVGGEQEKGLRPGTLNVAGIAGLGEACQILNENMKTEIKKLCGFQRRLFDWAKHHEDEVVINGSLENRLCNNVSLSFKTTTSDVLRSALSGVAYSSGSACTSSNPKPSHVLTAIGRDPIMAKQTIRLGMGRSTTPDQIETIISKLDSALS